MNQINVLWVDDDSPRILEPVSGFTVRSVKSCRAAIDLIESKAPPPDWVVVDLIVPQGNWLDSYVMLPGLELLKHLRKKSAIGLVAFSVVMTGTLKSMAVEAGANESFAKTDHSWHEVLQAIRILDPKRMKRQSQNAD